MITMTYKLAVVIYNSFVMMYITVQDKIMSFSTIWFFCASRTKYHCIRKMS